MTLNTASAIASIIKHNKPFYASELGLNGGTIGAIALKGIIRKTGNSKTYYVDVYGNIAIKAEVYEWELVKGKARQVKGEVRRLFKQAKALVDIVETWE